MSSKVVPFRPREVGDWVMGGSGDLEGKRRFGLSPQDVAQIAVQTYGELRVLCEPGTSRTEFVNSLGAALRWCLCREAGVPVRNGEDDDARH